MKNWQLKSKSRLNRIQEYILYKDTPETSSDDEKWQSMKDLLTSMPGNNWSASQSFQDYEWKKFQNICVIFFHCISVLTDTTDGEDDLDKFLAGPLSQLSSNTVAPSTPYNSEADLSDNSRQLWGHDWATLHLLCINRIPDIFYWMKSTTKIKKAHFFSNIHLFL